MRVYPFAVDVIFNRHFALASIANAYYSKPDDPAVLINIKEGQNEWFIIDLEIRTECLKPPVPVYNIRMEPE